MKELKEKKSTPLKLIKFNFMAEEFEKKNIFQKRDIGASREELRHALDNAYNPNVNFPRQERVELEKRLFPQEKYGPNISEKDVDKKILQLTKEKHSTPHYDEQVKIQHTIDLLERLKKAT